MPSSDYDIPLDARMEMRQEDGEEDEVEPVEVDSGNVPTDDDANGVNAGESDTVTSSMSRSSDIKDTELEDFPTGSDIDAEEEWDWCDDDEQENEESDACGYLINNINSNLNLPTGGMCVFVTILCTAIVLTRILVVAISKKSLSASTRVPHALNQPWAQLPAKTMLSMMLKSPFLTCTPRGKSETC